MQVYDRSLQYQIASGTAAGLLVQADAIFKKEAELNKSFASNNRAPVVIVPGVSSGTIRFDSDQAYTNYLNRSTPWLIPESAVASTFQNTLGRAPDQGNIFNLETLINAGGSLSSVQWGLAHSSEAADRLVNAFTDVLNQPFDPATLLDWQARLGTTSLSAIRTYLAQLPRAIEQINVVYNQTLSRNVDNASILGREWEIATYSLGALQSDLAHSPEGQARLNDVFVQTLNRALDGDSVSYRQNQLGTTSLAAVRWDVSHSDEGTGQLNVIYQDTLSRGLDGPSIPIRQDQLGVSSLSAVRWNIAHSNEATGQIDRIYQSVLGRGLDGPSVATRQNELGVTSLPTMRLNLSRSPEATGRVNGIYSLLLGHGIDGPTADSIEVNYLAQGGTLDALTLAVANSPEARVDFDAAYYLQQNPDVAAAGVNPYLHFATSGWKEGRNPNAFFDTNYYLQRNPDVVAAGVDPLIHYRISGWREGRDPSAYFNTSAYLSNNPDVQAAGVDPLLHFISFGAQEGRLSYLADGFILRAAVPGPREFVPYEALIPSARAILQYRIQGPDGSISVGVPDGYVSEPAQNGQGVIYRAPGSTGNANTMRLMLPNPYTPYPYFRVYNSQGQPISSYSGRPASDADTHIPIVGISGGS